MTFDYEKTAPVRWPHRRHQLLWSLYELASPSFQREKWLNKSPSRAGTMYGFEFVINFFFDDTDLAEHPETTLGDILVDELEVSAVRRLGEALNDVYKHVGPRKSDLEYLSSSIWQHVITSAQNAYSLLRPRVISEGDNIVPPDLP